MRWAKLGNKRLVIVTGLAIVVVSAGVGWLQREPLQAWFYLRGLARADEANRAAWVNRVTSLDSASVPGLVALLGQDDPRICANAEAALAALCERWSLDDPRRLELTRRLLEGFPQLSGLGQRSALKLAASWLDSSAVARFLEQACHASSSEAHAAALELADRFITQAPDPGRFGRCRELVLSCLEDADADNRMRAAQLALRPGMDLQKSLLPLLSDPAPEVRRVVMPVVGNAKDVIETEDLLRWLHDPDAGVRRECERTLRHSRKLSEEEIHLGRLITDSSPRVRLQVLSCLSDASDASIYPEVWLRHLSHDTAPEVRFAAIRAIRECGITELRDRIDQMAHNDSSPTVCDFAQRYLASHGESGRNSKK